MPTEPVRPTNLWADDGVEFVMAFQTGPPGPGFQSPGSLNAT